jgi:hypothetical protein
MLLKESLMSITSLMMPVKLALFKKKFDEIVNIGHIKYDWDASHCYSYLQHPIFSEWEEILKQLPSDQYDEWYDAFLDHTNEWLYQNDECPPCAIYINHKTKEVRSSCGCHDGAEYSEALDAVEELKQFAKANDRKIEYLVTEEF